MRTSRVHRRADSGRDGGPLTDVPTPQLVLASQTGSFFLGFTYSSGLAYDTSYVLRRFDTLGRWTGTRRFKPVDTNLHGRVITSSITSATEGC